MDFDEWNILELRLDDDVDSNEKLDDIESPLNSEKIGDNDDSN